MHERSEILAVGIRADHELRSDGLSEFKNARDRCIPGFPSIDGGLGGPADVIWRVEISFTCCKCNNVASLGT